MKPIIITFITVSILSLLGFVQSTLFSRLYPHLKLGLNNASDAGEPLMLTPYLKNGSISLAQNLSRVHLTETLGIKSHSGFFTVNETYGSHHYFWYFAASSHNDSAPVILWLQGGPGATSLFGLFTEVGPIVAVEDGFSLRDFHWALKSHLIFIDNPVGTGFSFTDNNSGYCRDEDCVARDLYSSLTQFFQLFPHLKNNEFYLAGESYAGKYIPALAMKIHKEKIVNLKGMAMGNAYCDPINQMDYDKYLYQHGLLDLNQMRVFQSAQNKIKALIKKEEWEAADILMDHLMDGDLTNYSYFKAFTGFNNYYNYLQTDPDDTDMTIFADLLSKDNIRREVHVGNQPFSTGREVLKNMAYDILQSVAPFVKELLSHYRIMFYNGQLDIIVAYPLTENFLRNLNFSSSNEYRNVKRHIWRVDGDIAGYVKTAGNLTEILVRDAGHMVPHDQPKWAYDMITRFIQGKPFW